MTQEPALARERLRWKRQKAMQLRVPRGQVVSPRRRGYAGNGVLRQAFFSDFLTALREKSEQLEPSNRCLRAGRACAALELNCKGNNPDQIGAEEQTFDRAG